MNECHKQEQPQNIEAIQAELERLRQENEALKANNSQRTGMKVTPKGGLSVYGLGRFPVTLYKSQWVELFKREAEIKAFIETNGDKLTEKPVKQPVDKNAA